MKRDLEKHHIDGVFVLLGFTVFAACILLVLLTGADRYHALAVRDEAAFEQRTPLQYVVAKVRSADGEGDVFVSSFDDPADRGSGDTLFLRELIDGTAYVTRIYYEDGYLRELFTEETADTAPEDGEKVMEAAGMKLQAAGGRLIVSVTGTDGTVSSLTISLRGGRVYSAAAEGGRAS